MKFSKIMLALLLILALVATMVACGGVTEEPGNGKNPGDIPERNEGGIISGGGKPDGGEGNGDKDLDADDAIAGNMTFAVIDEEAATMAITGHSGNYTGVLNIPSTFEKNDVIYTIVRIDAGAFADQEDVTEIVVPDTVLEIGQGAFSGCAALTELTVPFVGGSATSDTYIGYIFGASSFTENAKYVPAGLATVTLGDACTSIADFAFDYCANLTTVHIGANVASIGNCAFNACALTEIVVPDSVTQIGVGAFAKCPITKMTLPFIGADSTAKIGYIGHLFGATSYLQNNRFVPAGLTNITLSSACTKIGDGALYDCLNLETPVLPDTITAIGADAFANTKFYNAQPDGLVYVGNVLYAFKGEMENTDIVVRDNTIAIAANAFAGYPITSIVIPDSVVAIGYGAFSGANFSTIELSFVGGGADSGNTHLGYIFGALTAADNASAVPATLKSIVLRQNCTEIGALAFYGCNNLERVTLGAGVTDVAKDAFFYCTKLSAITVDAANTALKMDSGLLYNAAGNDLLAVPGAIAGEITLLPVVEIADGMFRACVGITSIVLPDTLTTVGDEAFKDAAALRTFNFPTSLANIGDAAFEGTEWYNAQPDGLVYTGRVLYKCKGEVTGAVSVADGIIGIAAGAFENSAISSVYIPTSVAYIGEGAFAGCSLLEEMTLPFVGASADDEAKVFLGYLFGSPAANRSKEYIPASLAKVTIMEGCTTLGNGAFAGCATVRDISLPSTLLSVATDSLKDSGWFKNHEPGVVYAGRIAYAFVPHKLGYYDLLDAIANTPAGEIPPVNVYDVVLRADTIKINNAAFKESAIHSIRIPDSVTYIGQEAFYTCDALASVRMPTNLEFLGTYAFYSCRALTSIYIPGSIGEIGEYTFYGCRSLRAVYIDGLLNNIGKNAFNNCDMLVEVYASFSRSEWRTLSTSADSSNASTIFNSSVKGTFGKPVPNDPYLPEETA